MAQPYAEEYTSEMEEKLVKLLRLLGLVLGTREKKDPWFAHGLSRKSLIEAHDLASEMLEEVRRKSEQLRPTD